MTDRAEPGVTPLTDAEVSEGVRFHAEACGYCSRNLPCYEARLLATLDATTPRLGLVGCAYECPYTEDGHQANDVDHEYVASGTGEPGLDVRKPPPLVDRYEGFRAACPRCGSSLSHDHCVECGAKNAMPWMHELACSHYRPATEFDTDDARAFLANDKGADPTPEPDAG
jgi:hypothetical protein